MLAGWGLTNTVTLNLGVDTEAFRPVPRDPALRKELDLPADRQVLLYVGRLSPEKNIEMLLASFEELCARHPNRYHLVMVGDGPLRRLLPATRHRTGALTWRSYVQENTDLARYYHAADLFIHPGVCETFGLVVLEAQACGLPCVGIAGSFMDANVMAGWTSGPAKTRRAPWPMPWNGSPNSTCPRLARRPRRRCMRAFPGSGSFGGSGISIHARACRAPRRCTESNRSRRSPR